MQRLLYCSCRILLLWKLDLSILQVQPDSYGNDRGLIMPRSSKYQLIAIILVVFFIAPVAAADKGKDFQRAYRSYQQHIEANNLEQALPAAEDAYNLGSRLYGRKSLNAAKLAINFATLLNDTGEFKRARRVLKGKLKIMEETYDTDADELVALLMELGRAEFDTRRPKDGLAYFERISAMLDNHENDLYRGMKNWDIVKILLRRQGNAFTRKYVEAAHEYYSNQLIPSDIRLGLASYHMALWKLADNQFEEAVSYLDASLIAFKTDESQMYELEKTVRMMLVNTLEYAKESELATTHCLALGRNQTWKVPAKPLYVSMPDFPPELTNTALVGEFTLEFTIDEDGFVRNPGVTRSTHADMDEVVMEAIGEFRYAPRFVEGKPVATEGMNYTFSIDFSRAEGKNNFFTRPPLRGWQSGSKSGDDPFTVGGGGKGGGK